MRFVLLFFRVEKKAQKSTWVYCNGAGSIPRCAVISVYNRHSKKSSSLPSFVGSPYFFYISFNS